MTSCCFAACVQVLRLNDAWRPFTVLNLKKYLKMKLDGKGFPSTNMCTGKRNTYKSPLAFLIKKDNKIAPQRRRKKKTPFVLSPTQGLNARPVRTLWSRLKGQGRFLIYKHKKTTTSLKASLTYQLITVKKLNIPRQSNAVLWSEKATCKTIKRTSDKVLKKKNIRLLGGLSATTKLRNRPS